MKRRSIPPTILLFLALSLCSLPFVSAANVYLDTPDIDVLDDTYVRNLNPTTNYGTAAYFEVLNGTGALEYSLIRFNVSSVLSDRPEVTDAKIKLRLNINALDGSGEVYTIRVYHVFQNYTWNETGVTWNTRPNETLNEYNFTSAGTLVIAGGDPLGDYEITLTNLVSQVIDNNEENITLYLIPETTAGTPIPTDFVQFRSKESPTLVYPGLNITYDKYITYVESLADLQGNTVSVSGNITGDEGTHVGITNTTPINASQGVNNYTLQVLGYYNNSFRFTYDIASPSNITLTNMSNAWLYFNLTNGTEVFPTCTMNGDAMANVGNYYALPDGSVTLNCAAGIGYPSFTDTFTKTAGTTINRTINVSMYNASLTFKDELTDDILTTVNITVNFIGPSNHTYSTTTGTLNVLNTLTTGNYTIRYTSANYSNRDYYISLSDTVNESYTLYLIETAESNTLPITVSDLQGNLYTGAVIHWLRWFPEQNAYLTVEMVTTREGGQANVYFEQYDAWYKALIYTDDTLRQSVDPRRYTPTDVTNGVLWAVDTDEDSWESWIPAIGMMNANDLTYSSGTRSFSFTYSDTNNIVDEVCLNVYESVRRTTTLVNQSCSSASSATLVAAHPVSTGTITAKVIFESNTENSVYTLALMTKEFISNSAATFGQYGPFLAGIVTATLGLIGGVNPVIPMVLAISGLLISVVGFGLAISQKVLLLIAITGLGLGALMAWRRTA